MAKVKNAAAEPLIPAAEFIADDFSGDSFGEGNWSKSLRAPVIEFELNRPVAGIFRGKKVVPLPQRGLKDAILYTLESKSGKMASFWGGAVLNELLSPAKEGDIVRITYMGEDIQAKKGQNPAKLYTVEFLK